MGLLIQRYPEPTWDTTRGMWRRWEALDLVQNLCTKTISSTKWTMVVEGYP